jgi:hypothetical protein
MHLNHARHNKTFLLSRLISAMIVTYIENVMDVFNNLK